MMEQWMKFGEMCRFVRGSRFNARTAATKFIHAGRGSEICRGRTLSITTGSREIGMESEVA